jgi:hypothetical protein
VVGEDMKFQLGKPYLCISNKVQDVGYVNPIIGKVYIHATSRHYTYDWIYPSETDRGAMCFNGIDFVPAEGITKLERVLYGLDE